ncbi:MULTISPECIES: hypothetical protein [unclassified Mycobacterium]|uniref:hypothetical protein n=1 Tax=unclassified Mycobacterium TaxID=2642494 RepID=UPI0029C9AEBE|nr:MULTISPECIES: hypothetical protein [unclassified Mycobacterium]
MWESAGIDTDQTNEQDRHALARLLQARGEQHAAAIVAVSGYQDVCVDNWDGGQYEAVLAVPPELYDHARNEFAVAIDKACADLIGEERYRGLVVTLRRTPVDPDWVAGIVQALRPRWVPSERSDVAELDPAQA